MSHTTTVSEVVIKDIAAIRDTVKELQQQGIKCELLKDTVPNMFYRNQHKACAYVLRLEGCRYDIGLEKNGNQYDMVFDEYGDHLKSILKCNVENNSRTPLSQVSKFVQLYQKNALIREARRQGHIVEGCTQDSKGNLQLKIRA